MSKTMTLEQFNQWHADSIGDVQPYDCYLQGIEDAHLAEREQSVDVGAIWEVIEELRARPANDRLKMAEKLTRALSGAPNKEGE